jgi:rhomboid protease GluP
MYVAAVRFAAIYLVSGVVSMIYSAVFSPQSVTVGASGALFGILGAMLGEMSQNCHLLTLRDRICGFTMLLATILLNLCVGLLPVRNSGRRPTIIMTSIIILIAVRR